jgi:hypothetical protein
MTPIEKYAMGMVVSGTRHVAEDDLNEDGELSEPDWIEACNLGLLMARAIEENPQVILNLVAPYLEARK